MKHLFIVTLALLPALLAAQTDAEKIEACFNGYKTAILNGDGEGAERHVDSKTIQYYNKMLDAALHSNKAAVEGMGLIDKITVLVARVKVPAEEMKTMNGKSFLIYAVDNGMVGKNSVQNLEFNEANVSGNTATSTMKVNGQVVPFGFEYTKEDGSWKLDITSVFEVSEKAFAQVVGQSGMSENEFLLNMLGMLTGSTVDESVWNPLDQ